MARILENHVVKASNRGKHDWKQYATGKSFLLVRGEDYTCKDGSIRQMTRNWADRNGYKVACESHKDGMIVTFTKVKSK